LGCDAGAIVARLDRESDVAVRQALILSLGEFSEAQWPASDRAAAQPKLKSIYQTAEEPGLRATAGWLLARIGQGAWLKQIDEPLAKDKADRDKRLAEIKAEFAKPKAAPAPRWYMNARGETMIAIPGPIEFQMGAPAGEEGREDDERQHLQRIGRSFAIAAKPVTAGEFRAFDATYKPTPQQAASPDSPAVNVSWYQAAAYCNWLSKQEGIPPEQWCYEADAQSNTAGGQTSIADAKSNIVKMKDKFLSLSGYRLPTEPEMEYATRAGTTTSRYYGETDRLLPKYAWFSTNSQMHTWPVATLKPNDFGLFDTLGNAYGWCHNTYEQYPAAKAGEAIDDSEGKLTVDPTAARVLRGGSFNDQALIIRSAYRHINVPTYRSSYLGFRVARTIGE
jgi:hypothetical protein